MKLRKLHKTLGVYISPFLLLVSGTGLALLGRKDNLYDPETKRLLIGLHTWEVAAKYTGGILAIGLITMVTTGLILTLKPKMKRKRAMGRTRVIEKTSTELKTTSNHNSKGTETLSAQESNVKGA